MKNGIENKSRKYITVSAASRIVYYVSIYIRGQQLILMYKGTYFGLLKRLKPLKCNLITTIG